MNKIITILNEPSGFNIQAAKDFVSKYSVPVTDFLIWAIPISTSLFILYKYMVWMPLDEQEKQQKPFFKSIKTVLLAAIIATSASAILKIFGIS